MKKIKNIFENGRTMLEMLAILAILASVGIGITAGINHGMLVYRASVLHTQLPQIKKAIENTFSFNVGLNKYENIGSMTQDQYNDMFQDILGKDACDGNSCKTSGGKFYLSSVAGGLGYKMTFDDMPKGICQELADSSRGDNGTMFGGGLFMANSCNADSSQTVEFVSLPFDFTCPGNQVRFSEEEECHCLNDEAIGEECMLPETETDEDNNENIVTPETEDTMEIFTSKEDEPESTAATSPDHNSQTSSPANQETTNQTFNSEAPETTQGGVTSQAPSTQITNATTSLGATSSHEPTTSIPLTTQTYQTLLSTTLLEPITTMNGAANVGGNISSVPPQSTNLTTLAPRTTETEYTTAPMTSSAPASTYTTAPMTSSAPASTYTTAPMTSSAPASTYTTAPMTASAPASTYTTAPMTASAPASTYTTLGYTTSALRTTETEYTTSSAHSMSTNTILNSYPQTLISTEYTTSAPRTTYTAATVGVSTSTSATMTNEQTTIPHSYEATTIPTTEITTVSNLE